MPAKPQGDKGPPFGPGPKGDARDLLPKSWVKQAKIDKARAAKMKKDKGPQEPAGKVKITVDTTAAAKGGAALRKMFDRMRDRIMTIFIEWLQSPEGQEAIKKAIRQELKR